MKTSETTVKSNGTRKWNSITLLTHTVHVHVPVVRPVSHAATLNGDCSGGLTIAFGLGGEGKGRSSAGGGHISSPS